MSLARLRKLLLILKYRRVTCRIYWAMHAQFIVCSDDKLMTHLEDAIEVDSERLVLVEKYLADAIEVNVDALLTPKAMW